MSPPAAWTSWRDRRDGTVATVVRVMGWDRRIAVSPPGGHGVVRADVERARPAFARPRREVCRIDQHTWEAHFDLIYDPHTGFEAS